jgi:hypothetical protein
MRSSFVVRITAAGFLLAAAWSATPVQARAEHGAGADGPEHGKVATSDASPVGARAMEAELTFGPSWKLPGAGPFERSPTAPPIRSS